MVPDFKRLLEPETVAIVGASRSDAPGRYDFVSWYKRAGFKKMICPVNPKYDDIGGYKCYPSLKDIPGEIDIAIMMVPVDSILKGLKETPEGKIKFVVIITSGFGEVGRSDYDEELLRTAREKGFRVIGPNCMGIYSRRGGMVHIFDQPTASDAGEVAIIAQSGGLSLNIVRAARNSGLTIDSSVSIGNQCDLCLEDFFEWFDADKEIKMIAGYAEDFKDGRRFIKIARDISRRKPVVLWKGGSTARGSRAAASHTGALAVTGAMWDGITRQTGIIPANDFGEIIELGRGLIWEKLPDGPGVCLISSGGGFSISMTDLSVQAGLSVPLLSGGIREKLLGIIANVNTIVDNPIDLGAASYFPKIVAEAISIIAEEDAVHSFIFHHFIYPFKGVGAREGSGEFLKAISEVRKRINKPVYIAFYMPFTNFPEADEAKRETIDMLNELKIPYCSDIPKCVNMAGKIWKYSRFLKG